MKKRRVFVIDDHKEDKRSMVDVPIICLDDDDDDNGGEDFKIVKNYEVFLDDLSKDDVILGYLFAVDNGESKVVKTEISRVVTLADIQRDNRAAERRKRRIVALETTKTSRIVPLRKTQQRDNKAGKCLKSETLSRADTLRKTQQRASRAGKCLELKAETLNRVETLRKTQQRANRAGKCIELKAETLRKTQQRANRAGKCLELKAENLVRTDEDLEQDNGAVEQRKGRVVELEAAGTSRTVPFVRTEEDIERDNLAVEQRKGRVVELEAAGTSRTVPLVRTEDDIERDNLAVEQRKRRVVELEAAGTSRAIPLVRTQEEIEGDNLAVELRKRRIVELGARRTSIAIPLVRTQEDIEGGNLAVEQRKRRVVGLEARRTSRAVYTLKTQQRDNRAGGCLELQAETLSRTIPLVRTQEDIQGHNRGTVVADKDYMSYIKWLVDSLKDSRNKPMVNAIKKSTIVPDKDSLVQVKVEQDVESWSDDSDLIAISDSPFMDVEDTMFVTSKKVIDLDGGNKEVESSSRCCFKKKLMDVLKKPYNEGELKQLHHDVSIHKRMTRCRELRKGREADYETNELGKSYLERFNDFENEYKAVVGVDKGKALELLRGFFFYLKNVSHDGSFKPWVKNRWWKP